MFKKIWAWVVALFSKPKVRLFIEAVYTESMKKLTESCGEMALLVVQELNSSALSGADRRAEAFKRIKEKAISELKEVKDYEINLLIEQAVKAIKG